MALTRNKIEKRNSTIEGHFKNFFIVPRYLSTVNIWLGKILQLESQETKNAI